MCFLFSIKAYIDNVITNAIEENESEISLPFLKLTAIPTLLCNVTSLVNLHLNDNHLEEIPDLISKLVNLEYLHLESNKIRNVSPIIGEIRFLFFC
jgi:Leucine-rich repeat (LRR) protein